jgi:mono/diheme cytochrome c family protein
MGKNIFLTGMAILLFTTTFGQQKKHTNNGQKAAIKTSIAAGKLVYMQFCVSCHLPDGGGVQNMNPPLINTSYINGDKARLVTVLLNGLSQQEIDGERYNNVMPSFNYLTDQQIGDVLTYVRNSYGNKKCAVTVTEVKTVRAKNVSQ